MKKFYSQAGQDKWVSEFFGSKKNGYFLDIGSHDGVTINNTYFLEKELNWDGICVEADPKTFNLLIKNRNCVCVNVAVSDNEEGIDFFSDGLSGRQLNSQESKRIPSKTIRNILSENSCPKIIDYLSLDIEGMELKALMGFPFEDYKVLTMTVEHNLYMGKELYKADIKSFLESKGYILYRENVESEGLPFEDWYINKSVDQ